MSSTLIPTQDLVPSVSSRVVTIDATSMLEATPDGEHWVDFILPQDLHVAADDKIIMAGSERVTLNAGKGSIRLPTYDPDAKTVDGSSDWVLLVKKSWTGKGCSHGRGCGCGGAYAIRVPVGTTTISLADLPAVRALTPREQMYAITGASVTMSEGAQWDIDVSLNGGILDFDFTVPSGGNSWARGVLADGVDLDTLTGSINAGVYYIPNAASYLTHPGRPTDTIAYSAILTVKSGAPSYSNTVQVLTVMGGTPAEYWRVTQAGGVLSPWMARNGGRLIPEGADMNDLTGHEWSGEFYVPTVAVAETLGNYITPARAAVVKIMSGPSAYSHTMQMAYVWGSEPAILWRITAFGGEWSQWTRIDSDRGGLIPANTNMNDLTGHGWVGEFYVPTSAVAGSLSNYIDPPAPALVKVMSGPHGYRYTAQIAYVWGSSPRALWRVMENASDWSDWMPFGSGGDKPVGASHDVRERRFKDAYPLTSTGGRGVVAFRYDHGLTNFKSTLLPLHQQYDIPAYIAMNSRNWGIAENSGASQQDARDWIASGLVEFGNHSADHGDRNTMEGIWDAVVNGRKELEAQLDTPIHGYTVPGLSGYNQFEGFNTGSLDSYSETYAGGLILANHGLVSGQFGEDGMGNFRTLDGVVRQGGRHYTWESRTWAQIKEQIDAAVATKTALTIMAHPRVMGGSGQFDAALAEQVISYVRERIDAGDLARMSYYQSHHAQLAPLAIDTGWRRVDERLYGWTGGEFYMRRVNDEVLLAFKGLDGTNATNAAVLSLPTGFGPDTFTGGSQAFFVRGQGVPDVWGSAGTGFFRLVAGFVSRTGTWASIRFPAEAAQPDMANLPGTARVPA